LGTGELRRLKQIEEENRKLKQLVANVSLDKHILRLRLQTVGWPTWTIKKEVQMEPIKFTLCPHCNECPEVQISDQGVTIGEDDNTVRLSQAEWNELVALIKRGAIGEV
jgi:hypothetical protein